MRGSFKADVETAAANVLDIAALIDPSKIILKIKYHLLAHIREDIIRFGPILGGATETYECFNAIFRFCSILSNHLAPSRDIALQLAEQEVLRHLLSGGSWRSVTGGGEWKKPAPSVVNFLGNNPFLATLLGYGRDATALPQDSGVPFQLIFILPKYLDESTGSIKLEPLKRSKNGTRIARLSLKLAETLAEQTVNIPEAMRNPEVRWYRGKHVLSQAEDECAVGTWIFAQSPFSLVRYLIFNTQSKLPKTPQL
jgi:hypothetical protein